jgi:putative RecB family exonuclease
MVVRPDEGGDVTADSGLIGGDIAVGRGPVAVGPVAVGPVAPVTVGMIAQGVAGDAGRAPLDAAPAPAGGSVTAAAGQPSQPDDAAERARRPRSLSPSRAADFKTCPLLYRFRTIDRLPERPSADQARGTLVHAVLEHLFDLPAIQRTPHHATGLVGPQWERLTAQRPDLAELLDDDASEDFLATAVKLLDGYFQVEDPRRLEPAERETLVEGYVGDLLLRGYVDRLDVSPSGDLRVVDYKTGGAPREAFRTGALAHPRGGAAGPAPALPA